MGGLTHVTKKILAAGRFVTRFRRNKDVYFVIEQNFV